MQIRRNLAVIAAHTGPDGAQIQELAGRSTGLESHSLARIIHPAGTTSTAHHHSVADEVYFVQSGHARLQVDADTLALCPGDVVTIRPGQSHQLWNDGPEDVVLVVTCAPAYAVDEVAWEE